MQYFNNLYLFYVSFSYRTQISLRLQQAALILAGYNRTTMRYSSEKRADWTTVFQLRSKNQ